MEMGIKVRVFNFCPFSLSYAPFCLFLPSDYQPQHIKSLKEIHETLRTCRPKKIRMNVFHHFFIWPLIAGLRLFEVLIRKSSLLLLLLDRSKDFLEIKYMNIY